MANMYGIKTSIVLNFHTKIIWILSKNFYLKYVGILSGIVDNTEKPLQHHCVDSVVVFQCFKKMS